MEQNTTSQAAQKQGVKKKKSIKQKLLAFFKARRAIPDLMRDLWHIDADFRPQGKQ